MKLPRRTFLHLAAGAAALPTLSKIARAQAYPSGPVRIIVGFPPGGALGIVARLVGQKLSDRLGQPFIVENRPGAASNIATEVVVRASPDGYTLLIASLGNTFNTTLYTDLRFNLVRDLTPVASIGANPFVMVVNPAVPAKTVPEFVAYAKANPGKINMGSAGSGTPHHVFGELFKTMAGVDLVHVPYRGGAPATTDLLGGQVQVIFSPLSESIEHIKAGKLRPLAVTTAVRLGLLPDVPVMGDFVQGYEASGWFGICAPKNTSLEIVGKLSKEINASIADPTIKQRFADLGTVPRPMTPGEFGTLLADETEKWGKVIRAANIKAE